MWPQQLNGDGLRRRSTAACSREQDGHHGDASDDRTGQGHPSCRGHTFSLSSLRAWFLERRVVLRRAAVRSAEVPASPVVVRVIAPESVRRTPPGGAIRQGCRCLISGFRSEEHTSELQSLMRISYAVFCLKK